MVPSLPSRGAWIEISARHWPTCWKRSLPSRGAWIEIYAVQSHRHGKHRVAPLTGSVDRNRFRRPAASRSVVAPLPRGVGRNGKRPTDSRPPLGGPPPGGGGWNSYTPSDEDGDSLSLPSRGAWIEINAAQGRIESLWVAPLTGSVDRNQGLVCNDLYDISRSPHGERG